MSYWSKSDVRLLGAILWAGVISLAVLAVAFAGGVFYLLVRGGMAVMEMV
jgi:hypothetical protein